MGMETSLSYFFLVTTPGFQCFIYSLKYKYTQIFFYSHGVFNYKCPIFGKTTYRQPRLWHKSLYIDYDWDPVLVNKEGYFHFPKPNVSLLCLILSSLMTELLWIHVSYLLQGKKHCISTTPSYIIFGFNL